MLLILLLAPAAAAQETFRAGAALRLLASPNELHVRRGAKMCADANNPDAVRLLLRILRRTKTDPAHALAAAHYRDIVWDALVAITDRYARRVVAEELRTGTYARSRQWCAELLGIYGDADLAPALIDALADPSLHVRSWAARSLGMLKHEPAVPALLPLVSSRNRYVRANAVEALARIDVRHKKLLLATARTDPDGGVRCALLAAVAGLLPGDRVRLCRLALRDEDWRPRMQAVDSLATVRTKAAVDALVEAAGDGRALVAWRAERALQRLTGKEIVGHESWRGWWKENRETFVFPELLGDAPRRESRTVAYGIPLVSGHVAFVIDKSLRMKDRLRSAKATKDKAARKELQRILVTMRGRLTFNVYVYRETTKAFRKEPLRCENKEMRAAIRFVSKVKTKGAKDIWRALETAVRDPNIDTIYLLSSGEPDVGLYVHYNRVTRHLRDLNRFEKVTVHTVVYSSNQWYRDQLEKIAEATGGKFKWFE